MACDSAERETEIDARLDAVTFDDLDRLKGDVVGVLERGDAAAAVIGDVELARQAAERAVVENMKMHARAQGRVSMSSWRSMPAVAFR